MRVIVETDIQASPEAVWSVASDIEHAAETIEAIEAKVIWTLTGFFVRGAMRKALERDLADMKATVENRA